MSDYFETEYTRQYLLSFVKETEELVLEALQELDSSSECRIYPALDLCFPYDVMRIAGGFPTGCLVTWKCGVPFIPVDTTVNVCTASIFELSDSITNKFNESHIRKVLEKFKNSSYKSNFHRGNHFISYTYGSESRKHYLILHSSPSEFTRTYNGLYPTPGNWYMDALQVYHKGNRYIRYITGNKADLFVKIAHASKSFNIVRHEVYAETLTSGLCYITNSSHYHHYQMPTNESVLIGCLLVNTEITPILTYPGDPIFLYKVSSSSTVVDIGSGPQHLIPHGWGKTLTMKPIVSIDLKNNTYELNGVKYIIESSTSLYTNPDLTLRRFSVDSGHSNYYFRLAQNYFTGTVVDKLVQLASYSELGYKQWN